MHQRGMGYIGAIIAMVIAGLIIYGIIYWGPSIWRGIQEGVGGDGKTAISDLVNNPQLYENQEVEVVGDLLVSFDLSLPYLENYGTPSSWVVVSGDDSLRIYIGTNSEFQYGWGETGKIRVRGIFRSPNYISAKRLTKA